MKMKTPLASLLAPPAFWGAAPAMALPPLDDFEIELRGEAQGWLNSTCARGVSRPNQTGIAASISQPSLSSSSARFGASSESTSMRRNLSPWLQYSLVNPITAGAPGCRQRHVDPAALIKQ